MGKFHIPGLGEIKPAIGPSVDAQVIVNSLGRLLDGVSRQLDLLIKLECGALTKSAMKKQIELWEAAAQVPEEQAVV